MSNRIQIQGKTIGNGAPCFIIAEAGVNHNGDVKAAERLVDVAAEAGADAVKFQMFKADLLAERPADDSLTARRLELLKREESQEPLEKLLATIRSKTLRERYKFDVERMMDLMENQFGPLDWRNAFAHTLYWASLGDELARDFENSTFSDKVNTARLVF